MQDNAGANDVPSLISPNRPPKSYRMDFDRYRDDQLNTGVIAALVGGFSLTNSWEMELGGPLIETATYVLAIIAVHSCTCSALVSAFLYRALTRSDPDEAVQWMEEHYIVASLPFIKFVLGTMAYLSSVILMSFKVLAHSSEAQLFAMAIGIAGCCVSMGTLCFLSLRPPTKVRSRRLR